MDNIDFDRKIKEMADSCQEPVPFDVWGNIEGEMARRRVLFWVKRVSYAVVAASVVAALVLNIGREDKFASAENVLAARVIEAEKITVSEEVPLRPERLHIAERHASVENLTVVEDAAPADQEQTSATAEVPTMNVEEKVPAQKEIVSPSEHLPAETIFAADAGWIYEEEETAARGAVIGVSSNLVAVGGGSFVSSGQQYMPGSDMIVQQGITPITKPSFAIPLTFGLQVQFPLNDRFAIGTGLTYTYLQSSFQALIDNSVQGLVDQKLHYLGIPVSLYVNVLKNNHFACYVSAGGAVEKGLQVSTRIKDILDGITVRKEGVKGLQWSANIGIGLQYSFNELIGIYFDPSLVYFFDTDQPFSIRTGQPFQLDMELGLRFNL